MSAIDFFVAHIDQLLRIQIFHRGRTEIFVGSLEVGCIVLVVFAIAIQSARKIFWKVGVLVITAVVLVVIEILVECLVRGFFVGNAARQVGIAI